MGPIPDFQLIEQVAWGARFISLFFVAAGAASYVFRRRKLQRRRVVLTLVFAILLVSALTGMGFYQLQTGQKFFLLFDGVYR